MTDEANTTVLVVDDNPMNVQVMEDMLSKGGFDVRIVMKGSMTKESAKQLKPSLIVLDIDMPDADGREVCADLSSDPETQDIPVLLVSAHNDTKIIIEGYEAGAKDYLVKPVIPEVLRAKARIYSSARWD